MKSFKIIFIASLTILFIGCKEKNAVPYYGIDFLFKESQPTKDRFIKNIPSEFIGNYSDTDSTQLIIDRKLVYYKWTNKDYISVSAFDSIKDSLRIVGNRAYTKNDFFEFRKLKDSIEITTVNYDTVFRISNFQKAKRIKNTLVLNTQDSIYWKIKVLSLDGNTLMITSLVSEEDRNRMDSLSKINSYKVDATKIIFQVSKSEFRKMVSLKKLGYSKEFKKLN